MFKGTNKIEDEHNFFQLNNRVTRPKLDIVFMSLSLNYELTLGIINLVRAIRKCSEKLTFLTP